MQFIDDRLMNGDGRLWQALALSGISLLLTALLIFALPELVAYTIAVVI